MMKTVLCNHENTTAPLTVGFKFLFTHKESTAIRVEKLDPVIKTTDRLRDKKVAGRAPIKV